MNKNLVIADNAARIRGSTSIPSPTESSSSIALESCLDQDLSSTSLTTSGPYIRVYDRKHLNSSLPSSYTDQSINVRVLDVSRQQKPKKYPAPSIKVPPAVTKIVLNQDQNYIRDGSGTPQTLVLSRPKTNSSRKYSRSNTSTSSHKGTRLRDPSQSLLPFPILTNGLKLYFQLKVLDSDEFILMWGAGSIVKQKPVLISDQNQIIAKLFNSKRHMDSNRICPAYLLLTTKNLYIYKPTFSIANLKVPFTDEQVSYQDDPSKLLALFSKSGLHFERIDVGPGRQYLGFHGQSPSFVFLTRSRQITTAIVENLRTIYHDRNMDITINQDIEYCVKNLQELVLVRPGRKAFKIYSTDWRDTESLADEEFDSGMDQVVSKVDFEFVKFYLIASLLRILKPVPDASLYGSEIMHVSLLGTQDYIYLLQERLDVWPPATFPQEFGIKSKGDVNSKGFQIDNIPQYTVLGVGRIKELSRIEFWRSWKIDSSYGPEIRKQLDGLGRSLQNGHLGHLRTKERPSVQQGSAAGWMWWARLTFSSKTGTNAPREAPIEIPTGGYFWDVIFSSKDSCTEFIDNMKILNQTDIEIIDLEM